MSGPHVGVLRWRWGHVNTLIAARTWGLIQVIWGTWSWGGSSREGGVTGYTCEGSMVGLFGGTRRTRVWEWEVTVTHVWQVVVLVVGQERRRMVVVVLLVMEGRS